MIHTQIIKTTVFLGCGKSNHGCWDAPKHDESETIYSERLDRFIDAECRVSACLRESPMSRKLGSSFSVISCACDATWESCKVLESWNETGSSATSVKTHSRLGMVQNWASNPASLVMFNVELSVLGGLNHTQVWYYAHPKNPPTPLWRAVKACLLGGNSYTKCSITFVIVAVAISALAGGAKNGFAPRPESGGVFDIFRGFLGVWAQEGIEMEFWVTLVAFRQWKNGQKWKKHCT